MKYFAIAALALSFTNFAEAVPCNRPVDTKKVVLMIAFHDGSEEERGASAGACARGERLVVLPRLTPEQARIKAEYSRVSTQAERTMSSCQTTECYQTYMLSPAGQNYMRLSGEMDKVKPDLQAQLTEFNQASKAQGTKVNSFILSGHDGGGSFYGDLGRTDLAAISNMVNSNREVYNDTSSLLLMGCWTGVPDQVDMWKTIFPKMRVLGGFVGSAPASTRLAAGQYISGILRGEANLPERASRAQVQAMINTIQNINQVTAGVYINPTCEDESTPNRSPAYYYVSPSQADNTLPGHIRSGLNIYQGVSSQAANCRATFGYNETRGTYDWNGINQYYQGHREPENSPELIALYSHLRNSEFCFTQGFTTASVTPEQVLMLRFFQDVKKNINKFFKADLDKMYEKLDAAVAASGDPDSIESYRNHKKLVGDSLLGMTRKETLTQISSLQKIFDRVAGRNDQIPGLAEIRNGMQKLDLHLYRLKCMHPTWHEYAEGETLDPPTCSQ